MRLTILHLSDIHFREGSNDISAKCKLIVEAVSSQTPMPDAVLIAVSGDIAFSGKAEEYSNALAFFSALTTDIQALNRDLDIGFVSVPGNHDCYLPESGIALRKALISGIELTINTNIPDPEILKQILSAQSDYLDFQQKLTARPTSGTQRLCSVELIVLRGIRIQVNLYNTALLSQRIETETLRVPVAIFDLNIRPLEDVVLSIGILHHTNLWLESNNAIQFRRHLDENVDLILSGHQHLDHAFEKLNLDGQRTLYLEGTALQDSSNPTSSGFNIIDLELPSKKQRVVHFNWDKNRYASIVKRDWSPLVENRAFRHDFRISENFQRLLDDPGAGYTHSRKREITLRDIYVYPDLSMRPTLDKPKTIEVPAEQFQEFLRNGSHIIFEGEGQSGRTAFAKIIFSDLLNGHGCVPVFIEGNDLKNISEEIFTKTVTEAIKAQYAPDLVSRFLALENKKRILIVDDCNRAKLNSDARAKFLAIANQRFGKVLLFSDPIFDIQEFATRAKDQSTLLQFQHATIRQFGYKTRARLITKWLTLGREHSYDTQELTREIDQIENVVTTLLGKNTLPKFPFIVLSVLQAYQEKKTTAPEAGSYGYVYEVLITTALASTAKSPSDIDKKYTFLSHLAYRMFKSNIETLSYSEIVNISEEYFRTYGLTATTDSILDDLVGARVLGLRNGNYHFYYSYYFEYFVARYYKDALQNRDERTVKLSAELSDMAYHVNWAQYSKILMFFLYFTKNSGLIELLIENSNRIFNEYAPATLDKDIEFADLLCTEAPIVEMPKGNVLENREARNQERDKQALDHPQSLEGKKIKYSETLDVKDKLDIARQHLELLGQILRNFPGSLRADIKLRIAQCTYLLGLRISSAILDLLGTAITYYRAMLIQSLDEPANRDRGEVKGLREIIQLVDRLFIWLTVAGITGLIKKVSISVGSPELDQTYMDVLGNLPDTNAVRLIDLAIRLDHFPGIPEARIRELNDRIKRTSVGHQVLTALVVDHLTFFEVDYRMRQRLGSILRFKDSIPQILEQGHKLLKGPGKKSDQ
jgi:hypothetical protein